MLINFGRSISVPPSLLALTFAALAIASCSPAHAAPEVARASEPAVSANAADLLNDITFGGESSAADVAYLQNSLRFLRNYLPEWYAYVADAQPLVVSIDEGLDQRGIIAHSKCCGALGEGTITFGVHFERWPARDAAKIQGMQAFQIQVLSTLIHEVTHIRDQRVGSIGRTIDSRTCIVAERSAYAKEGKFARALTGVRFPDAVGRENYRLVAEKQLEMAVANDEAAWWKIACLLMDAHEVEQ
jgi:hypothetical protein